MIKAILKLIFKLFPPNLFNQIQSFKNGLYTLWISNFLGKVGNNSIICRGCQFVGGKNVFVGSSTFVSKNSIIEAWPKYYNQIFDSRIEIGNECMIGEYNHLSCIGTLKIGNGVLTGRFVIITDNSHGNFDINEMDNIVPKKRRLISKGNIVIGDNVWIGDKVTILSGVTIGKNAIVGANSVVTKDIPPNTMVAGAPAIIIKQLSI